ncbi:MAG: DUF2934 domain-containing protein [Candidatus Sulfotelmatobacter sp.]
MAKSKFPKKTNGEVGIPRVEATSADLTTAEKNASETAQSEPKKPSRKPTIVKTEARASIVPINLDDEVRRLAYLMSERRGFDPGHETEDWLAAEREVRQRYRQQQSA